MLPLARYTAYAPFEEKNDDFLSIVCQLQVFFTLLVTIMRRANPESQLAPIIMNVWVLTPIVIAIIMQVGCFDKVGKAWNYVLSHSTVDDKVTCRDVSPAHDCQYWSTMGECTANPDFMNLNCAKSCGFCSSTEEVKDDVLGGKDEL